MAWHRPQCLSSHNTRIASTLQCPFASRMASFVSTHPPSETEQSKDRTSHPAERSQSYKQAWDLGRSDRGQVAQASHHHCKASPHLCPVPKGFALTLTCQDIAPGSLPSPSLEEMEFQALQHKHPCQIPSPMQAFLIMHKYGGGYSRLCCSRESL